VFAKQISFFFLLFNELVWFSYAVNELLPWFLKSILLFLFEYILFIFQNTNFFFKSLENLFTFSPIFLMKICWKRHLKWCIFSGKKKICPIFHFHFFKKRKEMFNFISVEVYCLDLNGKQNKKNHLQYKTILYFLSFFWYSGELRKKEK
jgi:hypothetical protein